MNIDARGEFDVRICERTGVRRAHTHLQAGAARCSEQRDDGPAGAGDGVQQQRMRARIGRAAGERRHKLAPRAPAIAAAAVTTTAAAAAARRLRAGRGRKRHRPPARPRGAHERASVVERDRRALIAATAAPCVFGYAHARIRECISPRARGVFGICICPHT